MDNISLLREKFIIRDVGLDEAPVIALGNRLIVEIPGEKDALVVRGHSMHMTLRFGAEIMRQLSYINHVEKVETVFQWADIWKKIVAPFEQEATPNTWISLYYQGKPIFSDNGYHSFFDVIEQCEFKNRSSGDQYKKSILIAQQAFQKMGRSVLIEEESHVGFILDEMKDELRFAIILRMPGHKSTFITRVHENKDIQATPYNFTAMFIAADYIEAINMAVRIGFMERTLKNMTGTKHELVKEVSDFTTRLRRLILAIEQSERKYNLFYRPDRPDFNEIKRKCFES